MKRQIPILAGALLATLAGALLAADTLNYSPMSGPPVVSASFAAAQSEDWSEPLDPQEIKAGDPTVNLQPLFSSSAASATIKVGLYQSADGSTYQLVKLVNLGTVTASSADVATIGTGTWYLADGLGLDSRAATHYDVRVRSAPSAGSVAFVRWTHGASGTPLPE